MFCHLREPDLQLCGAELGLSDGVTVYSCNETLNQTQPPLESLISIGSNSA